MQSKSKWEKLDIVLLEAFLFCLLLSQRSEFKPQEYLSTSLLRGNKTKESCNDLYSTRTRKNYWIGLRLIRCSQEQISQWSDPSCGETATFDAHRSRTRIGEHETDKDCEKSWRAEVPISQNFLREDQATVLNLCCHFFRSAQPRTFGLISKSKRRYI